MYIPFEIFSVDNLSDLFVLITQTALSIVDYFEIKETLYYVGADELSKMGIGLAQQIFFNLGIFLGISFFAFLVYYLDKSLKMKQYELKCRKMQCLEIVEINDNQKSNNK